MSTLADELARAVFERMKSCSGVDWEHSLAKVRALVVLLLEERWTVYGPSRGGSCDFRKLVEEHVVMSENRLEIRCEALALAIDPERAGPEVLGRALADALAGGTDSAPPRS